MAVLDRSVVVVAGGQGCRTFLGLTSDKDDKAQPPEF